MLVNDVKAENSGVEDHRLEYGVPGVDAQPPRAEGGVGEPVLLLLEVHEDEQAAAGHGEDDAQEEGQRFERDLRAAREQRKRRSEDGAGDAGALDQKKGRERERERERERKRASPW